VASGSRKGSAPCMVEGTRLDWSGSSFSGPGLVSPTGSNLAPDGGSVHVGFQESSAVLW